MTDADLPLETARLILRPFRPEDAEEVLALYGNPDVVRYLYGEPLDRQGLPEALERRLRRRGCPRPETSSSWRPSAGPPASSSAP